MSIGLFQPYSSAEFKGSLASGFFKRDLFGLDVGDGCVLRKGIAGSKGIRFVSLGRLDNRLWWCFSICRDAGSKQPKRFLGARGSPTEGTEDIVVNDSAVELGLLKENFCIFVLC